MNDNASNMKKVFSLFDATNEVSSDDSDEDEASIVDEILEPVSMKHDFDSACYVFRISCFAHSLQLTVKDGFKDADQIIRVLGKILN